MKIVGLVGHIGAGKTSIAKFLESTGYLRITLSDFLIQEARAREVAPTRVNLQHLGDELRRRNGGSVLFKRALEMANRVKADRVVIEVTTFVCGNDKWQSQQGYRPLPSAGLRSWSQ